MSTPPPRVGSFCRPRSPCGSHLNDWRLVRQTLQLSPLISPSTRKADEEGAHTAEHSGRPSRIIIDPRSKQERKKIRFGRVRGSEHPTAAAYLWPWRCMYLPTGSWGTRQRSTRSTAMRQPIRLGKPSHSCSNFTEEPTRRPLRGMNKPVQHSLPSLAATRQFNCRLSRRAPVNVQTRHRAGHTGRLSVVHCT